MKPSIVHKINLSDNLGATISFCVLTWIALVVPDLLGKHVSHKYLVEIYDIP
jgi:branched-subunit amino acid transport protein